MLKTGGAAFLGAGLAGCRPARALPTVPVAPLRPRVNLAVPRTSADRVIRTTVGLRPHRDGGFVLRADELGDKTLIHDYGHGGAGMSLSWGCGTLDNANDDPNPQPGGGADGGLMPEHLRPNRGRDVLGPGERR